MSAYGFEIVQTLIVDIEPDEHVKRAMNEINAGNNLILHIKKMYLFFFLSRYQSRKSCVQTPAMLFPLQYNVHLVSYLCVSNSQGRRVLRR